MFTQRVALFRTEAACVLMEAVSVQISAASVQISAALVQISAALVLTEAACVLTDAAQLKICVLTNRLVAHTQRFSFFKTGWFCPFAFFVYLCTR